MVVSAPRVVHVKWFASDAKNGSSKNSGAVNSNTSVNKSILSAPKKNKNAPDPALTIYPQEFTMPKLNKHGTAKPIVCKPKNTCVADKSPKQSKVIVGGSNEAKQQVQNSNKKSILFRLFFEFFVDLILISLLPSSSTFFFFLFLFNLCAPKLNFPIE